MLGIINPFYIVNIKILLQNLKNPESLFFPLLFALHALMN